jgi:hypothetical protein
MSHRSIMTALGLGLGLTLYALFGTSLLSGLAPRLTLALLSAVSFAALGLMILTGPLGLRRALIAAPAMGLGFAGLVTLAGLRHANPDDLASSPLVCGALFTLATLPWPFLITAASPEGWRDYPGLFRESWSILVRLALAVIFTLFLWAILFLSDALLGLAGLDIIGPLLEQPPAPWAITGAAMGLAVAVVDEIALLLSPGLILRLLRLLVPLLLAITALFLLALPFAGLAPLRQTFSAATTLSLLAALLLTLVTSALDEDDDRAVQTRFMRGASRALAALVLPLGLLALWAVGQRIGQYGLTPDRLGALTTAGILGLYGVVWAIALPRRDWAKRLRQANIVLALVQIGVALLWLTLLNPEALSARDQLARARIAAIPDTAIFADLGPAGAAALAELQEAAKSDPDLATRLTASLAATPLPPAVPDLVGLVPLSPEGGAQRDLAARILALPDEYERQRWAEACTAPLPSGKPGCVLAFADLRGTGQVQAYFFARAPEGYLIAEAFDPETEARLGLTFLPEAGETYPDESAAESLIAALQSAPPQTRPVKLMELALPGGGVFLTP